MNLLSPPLPIPPLSALVTPALAGRRGLPGEPAADSRRPEEAIITGNPIFAQLGIGAIAGQELLRGRRQLWRLDALACGSAERRRYG